MALPRSTAEITPDWLTEALRGSGVIPGDVSVVKALPDAVAAGVGFMGEVGVIEVAYDADDTGAPSRIVAKIPTQDPNVRGMLAPAKVFEREARFYADVSPKLEGLVPRCYFAGMDLEADHFLLLMEDLSGLRCGDQLAGCTPDDAAAAITALAKFQTRYWANDALAAIEWMPPVNDPGMKIGEMIYAASLNGFKAIFDSAIDPACVDMIDRFGPNMPNWLDRMATWPATIVHFDFRLDNLFFDDAGGGVRMIDFQTSAKGGGIYDVGYLLSQSLSVSDRRAHEEDLVRLYHDVLVASGMSGYSFDDLREHYRLASFYGWFIPVFAVGTLDTSSERAMKLWTNVIERAQAAMLDHECQEFLTV